MTSPARSAHLAAVLLLFVLPSLASAQAPADAGARLEQALRYVRAQEQVMRAEATGADVEAMLALVTDDYTYLHPSVGARVTGKDTARSGITAHLGETVGPELRVTGALQQGSIVTLLVHSRFHTRDGTLVERDNTWVLVYRDGLVSLRADF